MNKKSGLPDESGSRGALRTLKMCAEDPAIGASLIDAIRDATAVRSDYNDEFLATVAAFAIEGWKQA